MDGGSCVDGLSILGVPCDEIDGRWLELFDDMMPSCIDNRGLKKKTMINDFAWFFMLRHKLIPWVAREYRDSLEECNVKVIFKLHVETQFLVYSSVKTGEL